MSTQKILQDTLNILSYCCFIFLTAGRYEIKKNNVCPDYETVKLESRRIINACEKLCDEDEFCYGFAAMFFICEICRTLRMEDDGMPTTYWKRNNQFTEDNYGKIVINGIKHCIEFGLSTIMSQHIVKKFLYISQVNFVKIFSFLVQVSRTCTHIILISSYRYENTSMESEIFEYFQGLTIMKDHETLILLYKMVRLNHNDDDESCNILLFILIFFNSFKFFYNITRSYISLQVWRKN